MRPPRVSSLPVVRFAACSSVRPRTVKRRKPRCFASVSSRSLRSCAMIFSDVVMPHRKPDHRQNPLAARDGILHHSKRRSSFTLPESQRAASLEGEVVRLADGIAYINHDLDDAVRAGLIALAEAPQAALHVLGATPGQRVNTLVADVSAHSCTESPPGGVTVSREVEAAANDLREFLFQRVYTPLNEEPNTIRAQHIVQALFRHFVEDPDRLPPEHRPRSTIEISRGIADFIASTTDRYAIELYEEIFVPRHWSV